MSGIVSLLHWTCLFFHSGFGNQPGPFTIDGLGPSCFLCSLAPSLATFLLFLLFPEDQPVSAVLLPRNKVLCCPVQKEKLG